MSFDNEQLDLTLDRLTLGEEYKYQNEMNSRNNGLYDTETSEQKRPFGQEPKESLLSASLAGEQKNLNDGRVDQMIIENDRYGRNAFFSIDENMDIPSGMTDDHPEPILLASSVGKEIDGRMIPSSSTISLLSLNGQNNYGGNNNDDVSNASQLLTSPKSFSNTFQKYSHVSPNINQLIAFVDRKTTHNPLPSRNSRTHLNQIRLQPYQRFSSSPSPQIIPQQEFGLSSTSQSIPIENRLSMMVPDSPNLDPTSIGGSPSRFWLSSQTPPVSGNSSNKNSRSHLLHMLQAQPHYTHPNQQGHSTTQIMHNTRNTSSTNNYTTSSLNCLKFDGNASPILHPVQTPLEDAPMTPLYLNSSSVSQNDVGYFDDIYK